MLRIFLPAVFLFVLCAALQPAFAEKIILDMDELQQDADLPALYFGTTPIVQNRTVQLGGRLGFGLGVVHHSTELFYDPIAFSGSLSFFWSNNWALRASYLTYSDKLSNYSKSLENYRAQPFRISEVPRKEQAYFVDLAYQPIYGKISLAKGLVYNLITEFYVGGGSIIYSDEGSFPALSFGAAQNLFFSKHVSARCDLGVKYHRGPDVTACSLSPSNNVDCIGGIPKSTDYDTANHLDSSFNCSLVLIL